MSLGRYQHIWLMSYSASMLARCFDMGVSPKSTNCKWKGYKGSKLNRTYQMSCLFLYTIPEVIFHSSTSYSSLHGRQKFYILRKCMTPKMVFAWATSTKNILTTKSTASHSVRLYLGTCLRMRPLCSLSDFNEKLWKSDLSMTYCNDHILLWSY